ncbi:nucleotide pyrophosphohydrolase [Candidatus Dependentiae bacterium]
MAVKDDITTVQELKQYVATFIDEREWFQFHAPKSLSMSIAVEAAELMEKFMWCENKASYAIVKEKKDEVQQELADVIITALCFARSADIDIAAAVKNKMAINAKNYPVHKAKGRYTKHDEL